MCAAYRAGLHGFVVGLRVSLTDDAVELAPVVDEHGIAPCSYCPPRIYMIRCERREDNCTYPTRAHLLRQRLTLSPSRICSPERAICTGEVVHQRVEPWRHERRGLRRRHRGVRGAPARDSRRLPLGLQMLAEAGGPVSIHDARIVSASSNGPTSNSISSCAPTHPEPVSRSRSGTYTSSIGTSSYLACRGISCRGEPRTPKPKS